MALFQTKRDALKAIVAAQWDGREERDALLAELRRSPPKANALIPVLYLPDAAVRTVGAELFLPRADAAAVSELIAGLERRPPQVRAALVPLLARVDAKVLHPALEEIFQKTTPASRLLAWEIALSLPGPIKATYLKRAALEAPTALRLKAIDELVRAGDVGQYLPILLQLAREGDPEVSPAALRVLAGVREPEVLELMLDYLAEGAEETRVLARQYLSREAAADPEAMRQGLLKMVTQGTDATRKVAVSILLESGNPAEVVLQILQLGAQSPGWMRSQIIEALRSAGEVVLRATVQLMQHPDEEIRTNAVMALAEGFDDKRLVEPFCGVLQDPDWWLRVTACGVLGSLKEERAVPYLVQMLQDDSTRWAAVDALAEIAAPAALQPLCQQLADPREEIRQVVLEAFSHFKDARLLPIIQGIRDRDPSAEVRGRAGEILHEMSLALGHEEAADVAVAVELDKPLDRLLAHARQLGASDLHLNPGEAPVVRLHGVLHRGLEGTDSLTGEEIEAYVRSALDEQQSATFADERALDFCHTVDGAGRYRGNVFVERHGTCAAFRVIPDKPPTFADLRLPAQLKELLDYHQGVIIISGPAGCGKSTTLAALVNMINETKATHVLTMEDPIEFVHPPKMALVNQRQVGRDTRTFASGLRSALREDPDIIVVGELRDTESIRLALEASETGHLVIATLHTTSAVQTIDRLVGSFPTDEQAQVRTSLSESLKYVICQRLMVRKSGDGRVAVFEVLKGTMSIGNLIRKNETFQIPGLMQIGGHLGMRTLDHALAELVESELIAPESAWRLADKPETFRPLCDPEKIDSLGETT